MFICRTCITDNNSKWFGSRPKTRNCQECVQIRHSLGCLDVEEKSFTNSNVAVKRSCIWSQVQQLWVGRAHSLACKQHKFHSAICQSDRPYSLSVPDINSTGNFLSLSSCESLVMGSPKHMQFTQEAVQTSHTLCGTIPARSTLYDGQAASCLASFNVCVSEVVACSS